MSSLANAVHMRNVTLDNFHILLTNQSTFSYKKEYLSPHVIHEKGHKS